MKVRPILLPGFLALAVVGCMISGGPNVDHWTLQRSVVFCGLVIALVHALTKPIELDDDT